MAMSHSNHWSFEVLAKPSNPLNSSLNRQWPVMNAVMT